MEDEWQVLSDDWQILSGDWQVISDTLTNLNLSCLHNKIYPLLILRSDLMSEWNAKISLSIKKWGSLMLSTLGKIRWQFEIFLSFFPGNRILTFHANCLQWRQFAWNRNPVFREKQENVSQISYLLNLPRDWYRLRNNTRIPRKASSHLLGQKSQEPQSERGY